MKRKHRKIKKQMKHTGDFVAYHVATSLIHSVVYHTVGRLFR